MLAGSEPVPSGIRGPGGPVALSNRRRGQAYAAAAAIAWSTAGILQRQVHVGIATQVGVRALFALLVLGAFVWANGRDGLPGLRWSVMGPTMIVAVGMAVASGSFMVALRHTTVADVLLFQALAPIAAALLGVRVLRERLSRSTWAAMFCALVGVTVMIGGPGGGDPLGDGFALLMTLAFAVVIVTSRRYRNISMAPAACIAQLLLLIVVAPFVHLGSMSGSDLLWLALLGAGQLGLGLAAFTVAARLIPAAELAVITLLEVALGPVWVWIGVGERPNGATLIGGVLVIVAVVLQAFGTAPATRHNFVQ